MKHPAYLQPGDKVSIVSPASKIERQIVERGAEILEEQGFKVEIGQHAFDTEDMQAGTDVNRAFDLQKALNDKSVKAVFFSRGGYGSIRTFSHINWSSFFKNPKWLIGFSDITVFHSYLTNHHIPSVHGVMAAWFEKDGVLTDSFLKLMAVLKGEKLDFNVQPHPFNKTGSADGILTGGNLALIQSMRGTSLDISPKGKILFIEDIGEQHYNIDRMMQNLKVGKVLQQLSGLIAGYYTEMRDGETPFGKSAYEIIRETVAPYRYPVVFGFSAGHELPNYPMVMGGRISLNVTNNQVNIKQL
jgi:muramoyltetrapeptide carboxypeptidase